MKIFATWMLGVAMSVLPMASAGAWMERDVNRSGLYGTLVLPEGPNPVRAVLILSGSGPTDRNGNNPAGANDSLKLVAHGLAAEGIASLRVDKRGIAASAGAGLREDDLRIETYVTDAVAWLDFLRGELPQSRVLLLGHSEGALIATLAARRTDVAGLVLVAGAGESADRIIARQLAAGGAPDQLQAVSKRIAESLRKGQPVADVPTELLALYRPSVQNYLMSWLPLDPAAELARLTAPALIVQGTHDLQIRVEDAQRLAAGPNSKFVLIEAMNHVLREAPKERAANLAIYGAFDKPLAPELVPAIASFIEAHAR
ncbi:MAG: alpha/beta fold hydrolase [Hyphomicrobium denitrificans]|nr:alpha/beta fold hydrolase [Hyphomicrobium denitrificans]